MCVNATLGIMFALYLVTTIFANKSSDVIKILVCIFGLSFGGELWVKIVLPGLLISSISLIVYIIGILCIIAMIRIIQHMPKRTQYGKEMLNKIESFKNFLEVATESKLKELVMQNPNYLYEILPFIYVLDVSNKCISKFEKIICMPPSWYDSYNNATFNITEFSSFMTNTINSVTNELSISPLNTSNGEFIRFIFNKKR